MHPPIEQIAALCGVPGLRHAISTRLGGVSAGDYASLNLGYHVGDDPAAVSENRRRFAHAAGYDPSALVAAQQVHGVRLAWVAAAQRGRGAFSWDDALPETDGLLVAESGVPVAIQVADCAPVLLVDPVRHVLALVHAGWRGALGRIASAALTQMVDHAGTNPRDIRVGIGPALCPACLEVSAEIGGHVVAEFSPAAVLSGEKPHLDLAAMIAADLAPLGINPAQITSYPACTRCQGDRFFSHRGQQGRAGRLALVAWWDN